MAEPNVESKVPNGGWGWMCVVGCFTMHFLLGGLSRSFGIIYRWLQLRFDKSAAITAWIGGTGFAIRMGFSPLGTGLSTRYGTKPVVIVGGFLMGIGVILCAIAPSVEFMFFSYCLVTGIGGTLIYAPAVVIMSKYFSTRRSIANGISSCGSGFGVFVLPLLMEFLHEEYGYFGAVLILGGIELNNVCCGMLYRPLEQPVEAQTKREEKYIDYRMLKEFTFIYYALSLAFFTSSYQPAQMLLPSMAIDKGFSKHEGAMLLSVVGIADMVSRFLTGFIYDSRLLKNYKPQLFVIAMILSSVSQYVWGLSHNYPCLIAMSVVHGLFNGSVVSQRSVIAAELLGIERLSNSFGLSMAFQGTALMIGPLCAGYLRDVTSSYVFSFIFTGSCCLFAAFIFTVGHIIDKYLRRRKAIEIATVTVEETKL
ncbi:DgyrCDS1816 [Dimorphilus gyrociliatus]|uniref:DgyrCDS1816 n=1 Tax=Dimorphilus gyrociliatus TaxID=2664684 RepID=A0A7I8V8P8_9ANNE|nr:DgyrCDS1816 [Dimorphilus gyrociliatus]